VIVGEEILTTQGELLAAFVTEEIPARLSPLETIHRLRAQGAFISVSHPFDGHRGWQLEALLEIAPLVDAVEVFNARCIFARDNQLAAISPKNTTCSAPLARTPTPPASWRAPWQ
jgi:predicted metal-dependent phosphoesterase TrpH